MWCGRILLCSLPEKKQLTSVFLDKVVMPASIFQYVYCLKRKCKVRVGLLSELSIPLIQTGMCRLHEHLRPLPLSE